MRIGPLALANPVLVASGTFGYGDEYAHVLDLGALGGVITKTVTLKPRAGNPRAAHRRDRGRDAEFDRARERGAREVSL